MLTIPDRGAKAPIKAGTFDPRKAEETKPARERQRGGDVAGGALPRE